jgi:hypothetical protein
VLVWLESPQSENNAEESKLHRLKTEVDAGLPSRYGFLLITQEAAR